MKLDTFVLAALAAAMLALAACGGGGSGGAQPGTPQQPAPTQPSASTEARDGYAARLLAAQPNLRQVNLANVHTNAAGRVLTGAGVRIAIDDAPVDILESEFEGAIATGGATFTYPYYPRYAVDLSLEYGDVFTELWTAGEWCRTTCEIVGTVATASEVAARAREVIERRGYPDAGEFWIIRVRDGGEFGAWQAIPSVHALYSDGTYVRSHGTLVASTAAGDTFGMAPGATIVPRALTLGSDSDYDGGIRDVVDFVLDAIFSGSGTFSEAQAAALDRRWAASITESYQGADIVNESYGVASFSDSDLVRQYRDTFEYYERLERHFPRIVQAFVRSGSSDPMRKTLVVTAAGNEGRVAPQVGAAAPVYFPELRGLHIAAAALGTDGRIASWSNRCGGLPDTGRFAWNPAEHGPHYCLAAPGTVNARNVDGSTAAAEGTSFAAPIVSGALALMTEAFRGQLAPREIGLRLLRTANREGAYGDTGIYGAGVLDIGAATRPIGTAVTGVGGTRAPSGATWVVTPSAWGDVGARLRGSEIASFDDWNAPFWSDLGERFVAGAGLWTPPRPRTQGGADDPPLPHLAWMGDEDAARNPYGLRFAWGVDAHVTGAAIDAFGMSVAPFDAPYRFSFVHERRTNHGTRPSGAFGTRVHSTMLFVSREHDFALGEGPFAAELAWSVAAGQADYGKRSMLKTSGALYSAGQAALVHRGEGHESRLAIAQPLRAEAGQGAVTRPVGRSLDGAWLYRTRTFRLAPERREMRLTLRHDRDLGREGRLSIEAGHAFDAGHRRGRRASFAGLGYLLTW